MNRLLTCGTILGLLIWFNKISLVLCDENIIALPQGKIRGTYNFIDGYRYFLGVPYATVNVRYQEASDPPTWEGTFAADSETTCKQFSPITGLIIGTENCLTANIYTPSNRGQELLPVIVFVHGGGFFWGSNTNTLYNPKRLLEKGVVVVNINYRLGAFGFLCLETKGATGNIGMKDQVAALKWVKSNIAYFGGNPDSVTLFGESAGASSVIFLILSQAAKGLFHKAIVHSSSANTPHTFDRNSIESAAEVARLLGYNTRDTNELLNIFRNTTADEIVKASYVDSTNNALAPYILMPCKENPAVSENAIIRRNPTELLESAKELSNISIIMGFNDMEGIMWAADYDSKGLENLNNNFTTAIPRSFQFNSDGDKANFIKAVKNMYNISDYNDLINYFTDALILYPSVRTMETFLKNPKVTMFNYYFKYDSIRNINKLRTRLRLYDGADHADELFYLFDPFVLQFIISLPPVKEFMETMITLWTNFAKTGNPSSNLITWKPSEDTLQFLQLDKTIKMIDLPNQDRINFWRTSEEKFGLRYP